MYRTVETGAWDDPEVRPLSPQAKLLFFYLFTNRHTHVSGIYYLLPITAAAETGLPLRTLDTLWDTLSGARLAWFDPQCTVIFVRSMLRHQGHGEKNERAAAAQLETLHNSFLISRFLKEYPTVTRFVSDRVSDRVSKGYLPRAREEQEQEQEQEKLAGSPAAPPPSAAPPTPPVAVLEFPIKGGGIWKLTRHHLEALEVAFPSLEALEEIRRARLWCESHPSKRKTGRGMMGFLQTWLKRELADRREAELFASGNGNGHKPPLPFPQLKAKALQHLEKFTAAENYEKHRPLVEAASTEHELDEIMESFRVEEREWVRRHTEPKPPISRIPLSASRPS